jgi:hypothetical protein
LKIFAVSSESLTRQRKQKLNHKTPSNLTTNGVTDENNFTNHKTPSNLTKNGVTDENNFTKSCLVLKKVPGTGIAACVTKKIFLTLTQLKQ